MTLDIREYFEKNYQEDLMGMQEWVDQMYTQSCGKCFDGVRKTFTRMEKTSTPITDSELEWVLTSLPMELFSISEKLNQLRLQSEFVKLKNRRDKRQADEISRAIQKHEDVSSRIQNPEYDEIGASLVSEALSSVIRRIENEISFSKELIMGAKKIWDSRRRAEGSNPVGEVVPGEDLPDYQPPAGRRQGKEYIR